MASNSLLALLNLSNSQAPTSPALSAPPSNQVSSSIAPSSPPVSPLPTQTNGSTIANTFLQSILSPNAKDQSKAASAGIQPQSPNGSRPTSMSKRDSNLTLGPAQSPTPSTARSPPATPTSGFDLLSLLSGTGNKKSSSTEADGDTSFQEQGPRPQQQPIGTPPGQNSRKELSKSPIPTVFDSNNLFDLLMQTNGNQNDSKTLSANSKSQGYASEAVKSPVAQRIEPIPPAIPSLNQTYTINRRMHASHHLSGLHASAGFEDSISSGLDLIEVDGVQNFTLDLSAPQPGGLNSLYPAKLEITPISLLTTSFTPSCYINAESEQSKMARWPSQRVGGMGSKIVMYVMSKGRVRVIDQENGDRILAKADSTIRSVLTGSDQGVEEGQEGERLFAATTEKGGLWIWKLGKRFGQIDQDATVVGQLFAEEEKTFIYAAWTPNSNNSEMILIQSDGQVALLHVKDLERETIKRGGRVEWSQCEKKIISSNLCPVGLSVSSDGSLMALIEAGLSSTFDKLQLHLISLTNPSLNYTISLPALVQLGATNISFSSFADNGKEELPRGFLIGFDNNQIITLIDLADGSLKQLYRFKSLSGSSFSLAAWHAKTSSLLLCCSIRSSIFSLRSRFGRLPLLDMADVAKYAGLKRGESIDQSCQVLYRIKSKLLPCNVLSSQPALRECALPEPYTCFALDNSTAEKGSIRILASHLGGIHALLVPEEALTQSVAEERQEQQTQTFHGNVDVAAPRVETPPVEKVKAEPATVVQQTPAVPTIPAPVPSPREIKSDVKAKAQHSRMSSKNAKTSKAVIEDDIPEDNNQAVKAVASSNLNGIKVLLEDFKVSLVDLLKTQSPSSDLSGRDVAQTLTDKLLPSMTTMIDDVFVTQVRETVEATLSRSLQADLHNLLLRSDLATHLTRTISTSLLPPIQKTAMDVVSRVLAPHFESIMADLTTRIESKIEMGLTGIRKDIVTEQSKALLETETSVKDLTVQMGVMTQSLQSLLQQNSKLERSLEEMRREMASSKKPAPENDHSNGRQHEILSPAQTPLYQGFPAHLHPPPPPPPPVASSVAPSYLQYPSQAPPASSQGWQPSYNISKPDPAPLFASIPSRQQQPEPQVRGMTSQEVEDALLSCLSSPSLDSDTSPLQSTLSSISSQCGSPVSAIWDKSSESASLNKPRISQAVILTLLHRLIQSFKLVNEQNGMNVEMAVPWIEACAAALDKTDETISRYFEHIKRDMIQTLIQAHIALKDRVYWWTDDRLAYGVLRFIQ